MLTSGTTPDHIRKQFLVMSQNLLWMVAKACTSWLVAKIPFWSGFQPSKWCRISSSIHSIKIYFWCSPWNIHKMISQPSTESYHNHLFLVLSRTKISIKHINPSRRSLNPSDGLMIGAGICFWGRRTRDLRNAAAWRFQDLYLDSCWMGWMAWTDWFLESSIKTCGENVWVYDVCCFFAAMFLAKLVVEICRVILSSFLAIRWGSMAREFENQLENHRAFTKQVVRKRTRSWNCSTVPVCTKTVDKSLVEIRCLDKHSVFSNCFQTKYPPSSWPSSCSVLTCFNQQ